MDVEQLAYDDPRSLELLAHVERDVRRIPGVEEVASAYNVPLGYVRIDAAIDVEGDPRSAGERAIAGVNYVSQTYFAVMGVPLIDGRRFVEDEARVVAVVNQRFAELAWPGDRAIGRRFSSTGPGGPWIEVIGVTPTGK